MTRDPVTGTVSVNEDRCQGCFMCAMVCSFGAISAHPTLRVAVKCDRCPERVEAGREPACVESCPTHALQFGDEEDLAKEKRLSAASRVAHAVSGSPVNETVSSPLNTLRTLRGL
jgi:carbon-monoxide dehydrogenase iron sulfur subunit